MAEATLTGTVPRTETPGAPPRTDFQVVPLAGLPIVAAIIAGLIVAIAGNWLWALDFFHVVGGGLWTGIDLFVGFVIGPILGGLSRQARREFSIRFMPKMLLIMPTLVTMTLASGWQLARHAGEPLALVRPSFLAGGIVYRGRRHGGDRHRHSRAGECSRPVRNEEAASQRRTDSAGSCAVSSTPPGSPGPCRWQRSSS